MNTKLPAMQIVGLLGFAALAGMQAAAQMQTWYLDPPHSSAQFSVRHMGISTVRGAFTKVNGTVEEATDPSKDSVNVTIDAASIDTRVEMRDKDLRSDHFFDVTKYPSLTFQSTKVEPAGAGKLKVIGNLTMHGVTKEVVLDVDGPTAPIKDMRGNARRGLSATTTINRTDFGMTQDAGMIGDSVSIQLDVEMVDKAPGPPRPGPMPGQGPPPPAPPAM